MCKFPTLACVPLPIDPEVHALLQPALAPLAGLEIPLVGDVSTRRARAVTFFSSVVAAQPVTNGVAVEHHDLVTTDGTALTMAWYRPQQPTAPGHPASGSAVLYLHGGGMIFGLAETAPMYDSLVRTYVAASGVPFLMVDYRVAPEYPDPTPVEDCYSALTWLAARANDLGVDPHRLAVVGDSAGGGLAAGTALLARDRGGPAIALQMLIYPMLDDRTLTPDPELPAKHLTWGYDDNATGWGALLGGKATDVSVYAAPARAQDLSRLPATYIDVGDLDIFRDEDIDYARRLSAAGVPTELHVYPGCPHAFEALAPTAEVSRRVFADRVRRLKSF